MSIQDYTIKGEAFYLSKVFSSDFQYEIPDYQRPYSWEEEHIKQLFDDLYEFFQRKTDESYFLGSIVVIKQDNKPKADVVDGQQRLTSLTILFAALASYLSGKYKESVENYLQQPENLAESIPSQPRLTLRKRDNDFFNKYIQNLELDKLKELNSEHDCKTDAQRNIYKNALALLNVISEKLSNPEECFKFFQFLIQKCCLVIVSTPNQKSAFRIFSVMNNRGLDLLPTDILKADLIGKITDKQDEYTKKWEDLEQELGRNHFNDLFTHIRMINLKNKAQRSVLEELQELVIPKIPSIPAFIDNELSSYAAAFGALKNSNYQIDQYQEKINEYIKWLNRVGFSEWLPVAILFLHQKPDSEQSLTFFKQLEILSSYLHLSAKDVNKRIDRYGLILEELQDNPKECGENLRLNSNEKEAFKKLLNGNIYNEMTAVRRNYLILRLDAMISDGAANYKNQAGLLTIEHVLPQTINAESQWQQCWSDDKHQLWLHRLANLVPLNKRRNSAASNWDFKDKKEKYFSGNSNVSSYALTTQILAEESWTPQILETRQNKLLDILYKGWEL
ncbi:DUF262 domain-containing HNH endonuclease family protein [Bisgaard Taxon 10/6]|uniref:DUF262 domain-containing protein n=1 Tax=Exercitatus varius TaxID=67857 RepID=UPI00294B3756|nr:DUF262 domain-containing HNH endonuclease family protein [Exercitatus varius]MDG2916793.1 DUF262 domain-containing HNH endonuclease family protein [Exercitatus varius]